jgi:methylated-DNA-[protein]-cysteine S-methyltransferase
MKISFKTPIGFAVIEEEAGEIIKLYFSEVENEQEADNKALNECKIQILEYFVGKRKSFSCKIKLKGTNFQKKVWSELARIPYGKTISYKELATKIGKPTAFRAVANANRANPVPLIYPCHRVIGSNGKMVGYRYGIDKKIELLKLEGLEIKN